MPPKKEKKTSKKVSKQSKDSKKTSKKSEKKKVSKKVSKKDSKKIAKQKSNKKDTVEKQSKPKKLSNEKSKKQISVPKTTKQKLEQDISEKSTEGSDSDSIFTESDQMANDNYDVTETKMSEYFSDEEESPTIDDSEFNECKTDTIDSSEPKEILYNNLVTTKGKENISKMLDPKIVNKEDRLTNPRMTKYEMVRIIGERTKQLIMGAKPLIKNIEDLTYEEIAVLELRKNMTPFKIKRPLPNNTIEVWEMSELHKDHLEF